MFQLSTTLALKNLLPKLPVGLLSSLYWCPFVHSSLTSSKNFPGSISNLPVIILYVSMRYGFHAGAQVREIPNQPSTSSTHQVKARFQGSTSSELQAAQKFMLGVWITTQERDMQISQGRVSSVPQERAHRKKWFSSYKRGVHQGVCVPASDGKSNSRYVSCSQPSLHHHKASLGDGAI